MVMNIASDKASECYFLEIFSEVHRLSNKCSNINKIKADTEARPVKN
jgi:hypothetical protein